MRNLEQEQDRQLGMERSVEDLSKTHGSTLLLGTPVKIMIKANGKHRKKAAFNITGSQQYQLGAAGRDVCFSDCRPCLSTPPVPLTALQEHRPDDVWTPKIPCTVWRKKYSLAWMLEVPKSEVPRVEVQSGSVFYFIYGASLPLTAAGRSPSTVRWRRGLRRS